MNWKGERLPSENCVFTQLWEKRWKFVLPGMLMLHIDSRVDCQRPQAVCSSLRLSAFPPSSRPLSSSCSLKQPRREEMRKEGTESDIVGVLDRSPGPPLPRPLLTDSVPLVLPPQHKLPFVPLTSVQVLPRLNPSSRWSMMLSGKAAGECRQQPPLPSAQGLLNSTCRFIGFSLCR